jgi:opacity protein-like surface antigen
MSQPAGQWRDRSGHLQFWKRGTPSRATIDKIDMLRWPQGGLGSREVHDRMKKFALVALLLTLVAVAGQAQESRQDVSVSGSVILEPFKSSSTDVKVSSKRGLGALFSYRFMLTPRGAIEANYGYSQNSHHFVAPSYNNQVNDRIQEVSAAYVYNFNLRRFNPFVEAGTGALLWGNINNLATTSFAFKSQTTIVGLYGAGIAYEISPSFDIRVQYRGIFSKEPNFGASQFTTNKYTNINNPVIGVAYHF